MINNALENIRVVDLSSYIAGAFGPTFLADLGADVIKVEAPSGDPFRMISGAFQTWNRGKRSIVVDLRKDEGKEIVYKLVEGADVVAQNYRPSVAEKLGVPVKLSETPGYIKGPAPSKGENTEELLKGLGVSDSKIEELTSTRVVGRCGD